MTIRIAADIDAKLAALPPESTILLRRGLVSPPGIFEKVVAELAKARDLMVVYLQPTGNDRSAVYRRDYELVEAASRVEAYFASDRVMEGGTSHVVEAAMAREVPVYAWTTTDKGLVVRVGEIEPGQ